MANVKVAVRARPLLPREIESQSPLVLEMRGQSSILFKTEAAVAVGEVRDASKEFVFDHSYWSVNKDDHHFISQEQIFSDLGQHILNSAFEGYNGCIFAYGQTGSGKTYTMMGNEESPGLIPRICEGLFKGVKNTGQVSYKVEVSYMEIYNEKVRDLLKVSLLKSNSPQHNLKVREHPKDGPYVENLSKHQVSDYQAIEEIITIGNSHRVTAATKMNDVSSRSHAIFTITFMQAKYSHGVPSETVSKIHLVDLAGSERASQTGAEGQRLKEGGSINKSLVCLGNVIQALADMSMASKQKGRYIPYRDSVLTWLLKDSLGGNSKTIMIATVSPCQYSYSETLSTLRYASRAKKIVNKPKVNEDENVKIIRELRDEIRRLKDIISKGDLGNVPPESSLRLAVDLHNKEERVASLTRDWAEKWDNIQKIMQEHEVALRTEGVKMTVASEQPHLLGLDEDRFSAGGIVLYYLKKGETTIGHIDAAMENDIALQSEDIAEMHCKIVLTDNSVSLHTLDGVSLVNQIPVEPDQPVRLSHGDTLRLGSNSYLRFNHPQEAMKLRDSYNEPNVSHDSSVWSPLLNNTSSGSQSDRMIQTLEEERDAMRKWQEAIEQEYEDKIRLVQEQLKKEEQDKAALMSELQRLKEEKLTASLTLSSMSTPLSTSAPPPQRYRLPIDSSPAHSESDISITFDQREVTGREELPPERTSSPVPTKEQYPHVPPQRRHTVAGGNTIVANLERKFSFQENDNNEVDGPSPRRTVESKGGSTMCDSNESLRDSNSTSSSDSQIERLKLVAEQEKDELRKNYEKKLKDELSEKNRMRKEMLDLEFKLQMSTQLDKSTKEEIVPRTRSNAKVESDLDRSLPQYHSHRASRIKLQIPFFHQRGYGWGFYHVFEIQLTVGRNQWTVYRRYEQFRMFHEDMCRAFPEVSSLNLPPSKWFGARKYEFVAERRVQLERYLKSFIAIITCVSSCALAEVNGKRVTMETLQNFHSFFKPGGTLEGIIELPNFTDSSIRTNP